MKPCWTGSSSPSCSRPSTVRTSCPPAMAASTVHDLTGSPSSQTTQVPQLLVSQPQWVPVRPRWSRRKCTSSSRPSISRVTSSPLTVIVTCMRQLLLGRCGRPRGAAPAWSARRRGGACTRRCRAWSVTGLQLLGGDARRPGRRAPRTAALPRSASEIAGMPVVFGPTAASPTRASAIDVAVHPDRRAGRHDRPVAGPALDLLVGAGPARPHRDADLDEHLAVADRRLVRPAVELLHRHDPLAGAAADHAARVERGADRREVLGRVGLAQRAAERAAVAHHRVGDHPLGVAEDRERRRAARRTRAARGAGSSRRSGSGPARP